MSLINEALNRVKEAQPKSQPSASVGPQLRPVEPVAVPAHHGLGWVLPIALAAVALLTLLLLWELARRENSPVVVRAQPDTQEQATSANDISQSSARSSEGARPIGTSIRDASALSPATRSAGVASAASTNSAISAPSTNSALSAQANASPAQEAVANTNSGSVQPTGPGAQTGSTKPTVAEVEPQKPAPLKLQGIVFSARPSAVINGKTLFVGDRVREFRVVAITQDTAILVGAGRTNILSLSE